MEPTTHRPAERASWMLGLLVIPILVGLTVIVQLWPWSALLIGGGMSIALFVTRHRA